MFNFKVCEMLRSYVYALIDPKTNKPFYIGKGVENRVFNHVSCALEEDAASLKYDKIRDIQNSGEKVKHVILHHGLTEEEAFKIECALIDFCSLIEHDLTNLVAGHRSSAFGLMDCEELIRKYTAEPLTEIDEGFVLININKTYQRAKGAKSYYEATKASWVIHKDRVGSLKYALSEYRGFVVEVFKIDCWYPVETTDKKGKEKIRWGFDGVVADEEIRKKYLNKKIAKKHGQANPIQYKIHPEKEADSTAAVG